MSDNILTFPTKAREVAENYDLAARVINEQAAALSAQQAALVAQQAIIIRLTDKIDETASMFTGLRDRGRVRLGLACLVVGFLIGWFA